MTDIDDPGPGAPGRPGEGAGWQPLPPRARPLFMLSGALGTGVPALAALAGGGFVLLRLGLAGPWAAGAALWLLLAALGAWIGLRKYRYTHWLLDDDGFALRRGRMWHSEIRVPASRVQHLDIRRGPLERRFDLATLLIHTAGTRQHAVAVPGLDAGDAERLRDHLARRVEHDDDES